ncbi:MAG TPA: hypothetical protein GXZ49_08265 [Bacteroidetes bacterium]|jgi:hypothetical protein|nr:hypothetical protein [Bacteroidota bacterium]
MVIGAQIPAITAPIDFPAGAGLCEAIGVDLGIAVTGDIGYSKYFSDLIDNRQILISVCFRQKENSIS